MKLIALLILNIPICFGLLFGTVYLANQKKIDYYFHNPLIVYLNVLAVIIDVLIALIIIYFLKLKSRKSSIIYMSGVVLTWILLYTIMFLGNETFPQ